MTSVTQFLVFKDTKILYYTASSHTQLCTMKRWKESKSFVVEHCCLLIWIFTTELQHEINPFSGITPGLFQWATSLSHITNCGWKHTIDCNQRLSKAASVALQKSPTNLFPSSSVTAQVFFNCSPQSISYFWVTLSTSVQLVLKQQFIIIHHHATILLKGQRRKL